ncbi:putative bifunctional diguanylate cyclase/phosphodiesterase [Pseudoalteromonas obscura]|uniref:Bifunctional diguanylate cyclase/phosphodiesterase n=1 Tax=Pseudoalteromonas obscura TaxID=3048491 RepID=A0ABT7EEZ0_9GAMM|nr:bifunctional diguanylate cyclase/phosphodiesterase [Pseudoalteromonas sp. P94(2023)]MDK2593848.1 bifunctional diguanylate cyclase/phosphodiesterase [Pseudoalteromonas sp. P94(2023)]
MWLYMKHIVFYLFLLVSGQCAFASQGYAIAQFTDTSNELSVDNVIDRSASFIPVGGEAKFVKGETLWVKVSGTQYSNDLVAIMSTIEGTVKLYQVLSGKIVAYKLVSPEVAHLAPNLHILPSMSLSDGQRQYDVYIKVKAKYGGVLSLDVLSESEYRKALNSRLFAIGVSSGIHYFIAFFVALMALFQLRKGLAVLTAYFVCISIQTGVYSGANNLVFPSEAASYFATYQSQIYLLSLVFAVLFLHYFMVLKRAEPRYIRLVNISIWLIAALTLLVAPLNAQDSLVFHLIGSLICCLLYFVVLKSHLVEHRDEVLALVLTWLPIFALKAYIFVNQFGIYLPIDDPIVSHFLITSHIVLLAFYLYWHDKNKKKQLLFYATHDKDTGAPNRYMLQQSLESLEKKGKEHTLLLFRPLVLQTIRLNMGWSFANTHLKKLLSKVSEQLNTYGNAVTAEKTNSHTAIYRLDDSLFAIVLLGKFELSQVEQFVCILSASFEDGIDFCGDLLVDQLEIGVASNPIHAASADSLIQCAMQALAAKPAGTHKWQLFDFGNSIVSQRRIKIASALKVAIEREQLSLYLQPQLHLDSGRVYGAEALLRWHHPELGVVPPSEFIPIAESSGIVFELTEWVVETGLKQQAELVELLASHTLSLNISGKDVGRKELSVQLIELINQYALSPIQIVLEVTESATVDNERTLYDTLADYRKIGLRVAIDDFGTGYSSLAYLSQLGFDKLKIDKRFVMDLESSKTNQTICKATCDMAHSLGSVVVAEGIESEGSYRQLQSYQCEIGQGYFISRPLPFEEYKAWLQRMIDVEDVIHYLTS